MNLVEALDTLLLAQSGTPNQQRLMKDDLIHAFRIFWASSPSEEEFADYMEGVVLFPAMLYILTTGRIIRHTH